jgi:uncharacterized membrane protein
MLCWGLTDFLAAKPARAIGQQRTTIYFLLTSALLLTIPVLLIGVNSGITVNDLIIAVLSGGLFAFLANVFLFRAFRLGDVAINAPIANSYPIVQVLGAILFLGVVLSDTVLIGIIAIISGIILVSTKASGLKSRKKIIAAGVGSAIISMFFTGAPVLFSSLYIAVVGFALTNLIWRGTGFLFGFAYGRITKQNQALPEKKYLPYVIGAGAMDAIATTSFLYAFSVSSSNLPVVSALAGFSGGVTVILALVLLKERPEWNQWLGIIFAVAGVVLLSYFL